MRKAIIPFFLVCLVLLAGCGEKRRASREFNTLSELYRSKMDSGKTTPAQDKEYIRAISRLGFELDRSIRGTSPAEKTRRDATIMGSTGVDLNAPLNVPNP